MVKNNLQINSEKGKQILADLRSRIMSHQEILDYAFPKYPPELIINRYDEGMEYGNHVDAAIIGGVRTDISFTIFLEGPENYMGGTLILEDPSLPFPIATKPKIGSIYLYETGRIHRVTKVTKGSRLACVGWIQSRVREEHRRAILRELEYIRHYYFKKNGHEEAQDIFLKNNGALQRMWSD